MADRLREDLIELLPRLRRIGHAIAGSAADGDDLVQAACEKALARADQFREGTRLDAWVITIMRNHWLDHVRSSAERRRAPAEVAEERDDAGLGAARAEHRLMLERTRQAMGALPEEQRMVLALVALDGRSYRDAAEALDIPVGTVMSRLSRARLALSAALALEGERVL